MAFPPSPLVPFLALLCLGSGPCSAWNVSNRVVVLHGSLVIDHTKSVRQITQAQAQGGFAASQGLGLFQNRVKTELVFEQTDLKNKRLIMTTRITTAPIIYVAAEFSEGTCPYDVILGHELTHQRFDLAALRAMPEDIRAITQTQFSPDALDWAGTLSLERARSRFYQETQYSYGARALPHHQSIDNPASYRRLSGLCNGEITRRLAGIKP